MKKNLFAKSLLLILSLVMMASLLGGCGGKTVDNVADLTGSNWVSDNAADQAAITFTGEEATAVFVFEGEANASMIKGPYEANDSSFTIDDPTTGNKVEFVYAIDGDTLSITSINGSAVSFKYSRK